jgi:hypothetical protein
MHTLHEEAIWAEMHSATVITPFSQNLREACSKRSLPRAASPWNVGLRMKKEELNQKDAVEFVNFRNFFGDRREVK